MRRTSALMWLLGLSMSLMVAGGCATDEDAGEARVLQEATSTLATCVWNGVTYNNNAFLTAQCSARIGGVCRSGPFQGDPCGANGECTARCINGAWMHP